MQAFLFFFFVCQHQIVGQAFLVESLETEDKILDDFHCMQMNLVMSMLFIFSDDWNDAYRLITFSLFGNDVIFSESRPLIFV